MAFDFFGLFSKNPSKDGFANIVMKEIQRAGIPDRVEYDPAAFTLACGKMRMFLGNLYLEYCNAGSREHKGRLIQNMLGPLLREKEVVSREDVFDLIVTCVRERAMFSIGTLYWKLDGHDMDDAPPVMEPISEWYCKALALDYPGHVRIVTQKDLKEWELTAEELFARGLERLEEISMPQFKTENGYFVGTWNDDYDSSRVLVPELFEELGFQGDPVFVLPNRLTLMVADPRNEAAVKAMLEKAEEIIRTVPRGQNQAPLCYRGGVLQDFRVPPGSPLFNAVARAQKLTALSSYEEQGAKLQELYEREGRDYFVASYKVVEKKGGEYSSYCVWSKGIASLLPKADVVALFDPEQPDDKRIVAEVPWEKACAACGDLMLDTQMFPPRYYVSAFPGEEQLEALAAGKIP